MLGTRALDPRTSGVDLEIERDADDFEPVGMELLTQALPPGQRSATPSP